MTTTLLISDLHLSPERPAVTRAFFDFLQNQAMSADALYILGDLFEAWVGDDDPSDVAVQTQQQLKAVADTGTKVYFQHGNRDLMVGKLFARNSHCRLLPEHFTTTLAGKATVLLHGDSLCTDDIAYQRYRKVIRNPVIKWLLRRLPLKKRQQIVADLRKKSAAGNANKPENIMDVAELTVEQVFQRFQAEQMIHGHTHRPNRHHYSWGERIVLGDWEQQGWYIEATDTTLSLHSFAIQQ